LNAPSSTSASSNKQKIVVLDDWEHALAARADWSKVQAVADVEFHTETLRGDALLKAIESASVLVLSRDRTPLDAALIAKLPNLKRVIHTGPRNLKLDRDSLAARGIEASGTPGGPGREGTTEHTWSLILTAARQLEGHMTRLRRGEWRAGKAEPWAFVLHGKRLGLIGLGEIGQRVAQVGQAFGMDVVAWSPNLTQERADAAGVGFVATKEELLSTSRVVSIHMVATEATRHLVDAKGLASMQPDSILVNTSRPSLIDEKALISALKAGRPGYAALDVFDTEPLPADSELIKLPNVTITPHIGFISEEGLSFLAKGVVESLEAWLGV
jgi:phosphoglycerate dehydrogenase-like enzyme